MPRSKVGLQYNIYIYIFIYLFIYYNHIYIYIYKYIYICMIPVLVDAYESFNGDVCKHYKYSQLMERMTIIDHLSIYVMLCDVLCTTIWKRNSVSGPRIRGSVFDGSVGKWGDTQKVAKSMGKIMINHRNLGGTLFSDKPRFLGTKLNCEKTVSKAAARSGSRVCVGGAKKVAAGFWFLSDREVHGCTSSSPSAN